MKYPFPLDFTFPKRGLLNKALTLWEDIRIGRRERRDRREVDLKPLKTERLLSKDDLPLVFIARNELAILPAFLNHYRFLGVTRFICVDDQSTDGTTEYLTGESDVDVWTSSVRFADARRGRLWREQLFNIYGVDRWYINVDADELLVYDRCAAHDLKDLTRLLERSGISRMPAPMIDCYYDDAAKQEETDDRLRPWKTAKFFDTDGYEVSLNKRGISVLGGPRARAFGDCPQLMKYPVIYWDVSCCFGSSIHSPLPFSRNFSSVWGVLLHFKFYINYRDKIQEAASGKQHYNASKHYEVMAELIEKTGQLNLLYGRSAEFLAPGQLVDLGFMPNIVYDVEETSMRSVRLWNNLPQ